MDGNGRGGIQDGWIVISTVQVEKKFLFYYPHTLTIRLERPVYRGFSGEGKCEGKCFTLTLLSHLPSHPYSSGKKASCLLRILWMGVRFNGQGANKAAVYRQYSYAALLVQLCCPFGIPMLDLWYQNALLFWYCL